GRVLGPFRRRQSVSRARRPRRTGTARVRTAGRFPPRCARQGRVHPRLAGADAGAGGIGYRAPNALDETFGAVRCRRGFSPDRAPSFALANGQSAVAAEAAPTTSFKATLDSGRLPARIGHQGL